MEKVRRQHYVPRMYLKRFGYGNIDDEYISVLKLDNGTVLDNRKVENFAVANYFYDADKEQIAEILKEDLKVFPELCDNEKLSDEQFTEHALAREESAISKMLNELQEDLSRIHISSNRNLMVNSVIAYNCMQLAMGQKFLFGTSNTIKYMKKLWEARSASRNKRK